MNTSTLIAQAPAELLLGLGLFFTLAALALFALSCEAGNYRDLGDVLRSIRRGFLSLRPRRRWHFNTRRTGETRIANTRHNPGPIAPLRRTS